MSDTVSRFLSTVLPLASPQRELIVVPPPPPSFDELTSKIRQAHANALRAAGSYAEHAIDAGEYLEAAKQNLPKGILWKDYVTLDLGLSERTARLYRQLARQKDQYEQLRKDQRQSSAAISQAEMLRLLSSAKRKTKGRC